MGIFTRNKNKNTVVEERGCGDFSGLFFNGGTFFSTNRSLQLSAVYAATNQISNSCAVLGVNIVKMVDGEPKPIKHNLNSVLSLKPEPRFTHFTLFKRIIESVILNGAAYCLIVRDERLNVKQIKYLEYEFVEPLLQSDGTIKYLVNGMTEVQNAENILHFYMHCDERMRGLSVIKYAAMTLQTAFDTEKNAASFFKSGGNLSGVIESSNNGMNQAEKREELRQIWRGAFRENKSQDVSVAVLPAGFSFKPISVNPADAMLLQSRQYSVIEIARFFNISPIKLFDLSEVSYSSMESTNLSYLQDTIMPYISMMEDEMNLKLFKPSEIGEYKVDFDFTALIQTDKASEAEYYKTLLVNGVLSYNEIRSKLGYGAMEMGDEHIVQISYGSLKNVIEGKYTKNQLDNKVTGFQSEEPEKEEETKPKTNKKTTKKEDK